jgi:hypothetical protein
MNISKSALSNQVSVVEKEEQPQRHRVPACEGEAGGHNEEEAGSW